jgi:hypothetical protein
VERKLPGLGAALSTARPEPFTYRRQRLLEASAAANELPVPRRRRIWEISADLHCSIIGTCLTTSELRQILAKIELKGAQSETDHELHSRAVVLAGQRDIGSKLLQKALDRRHRSAIGQFAKVRTAEELRLLWDGAVQRAEIPGAYWAVLTHPEATEDLVRLAFGEVHMLSHLVGAANRADIRRLRDLEAQIATLQEKIARQQRHLRDVVVSRDATIASLNETLAKVIAAQHGEDGVNAPRDHAERSATSGLITDLRRRLTSEIKMRERAELQLRDVTCERDSEKRRRQSLEQRERTLVREVDAAEAALRRFLRIAEPADEVPLDLTSLTLLYVGGRANQIAQLRGLAEQSNATFLYHDGGIEDRSGLLEAQVARADLTLFPVDCVSHNAVAVVKRVSRSCSKPYLALRSSGLTSFAAALRCIAAEQSRDQGRTSAQA